ncbi:MAG TPA: glycosyltransferase [Ignavibacteriaceae bacterium]
MAEIDFSIILLRCDFTPELFELTKNAANTLRGGEKILIDNASTIGEIKDWPDILIKNKTNLGYPAAVNQGFRKAKAKFLVICNNDIRVSPNWRQIAKEIFAEDPKIGSVHFKMIPYDEPFDLGYDTWITGKERWCHSSFYVIRREAIPEGGYFEGYTKGGYDDYDFWHRIRDLNGWKQAYTNCAQFQHKDSSTYQALDERDHDRDERDQRNRELYKERFGEYPDIQFSTLFPEQMMVNWRPFP